MMTVLEFSQQNGYTIISCAETAVDREISGVYICDLLSMAMVGVRMETYGLPCIQTSTLLLWHP